MTAPPAPSRAAAAPATNAAYVTHATPTQPVTPNAASARPRVLLVDDDARLRKLVAMALEPLAIDLLLCTNGAEALTVLRAAPVQLLITDLMMPGVSGYDLLQALHETPALRGDARTVVFSAGLDAAARARVAHCGVWRLLDKPFSVRALEGCVREALALPSGADPDAVTVGEPFDPADTDADADADADAEQAAIARYFAGQAALFAAYKADCALQFIHDLQSGENALAARDGPALRRLVHNLQSVLRLLGHERAARQAQALEAAARADGCADWAGLAAGWLALSPQLRRWARPASPPAPA